ncbi:MAG: hypothetical protein KC414_14780, partial [Romboutsia sp.]|nr:hypothetical protein [Romboutsia sp.]
MKPKWSIISLFFLFFVASVGTLLRSAQFIPKHFIFQNLVHAHSHIGFQGCIYTSLFLFLTTSYLTQQQIENGKYILQFKLTVFILLAILLAFAIQGYALFSIIFSTIFQLFNYWFIIRFFKDTRQKKAWSLVFIKTGLIVGILSTLMPFLIGFLAAKGFNGTEIYHAAVYAFLHLQYNGWFLFVVIGLLLQYVEERQIKYKTTPIKYFYILMSVAVIPAISLSFLGMSFSRYFLIPAYFVAIIQLVALFCFLKSFSGVWKSITVQNSQWIQSLWWIFIASFIFKMILQSLSVIPLFNALAFNNKLIILAYLHLNFLGIFTPFILFILFTKQWLPLNHFTKMALLLF